MRSSRRGDRARQVRTLHARHICLQSTPQDARRSGEATGSERTVADCKDGLISSFTFTCGFSTSPRQTVCYETPQSHHHHSAQNSLVRSPLTPHRLRPRNNVCAAQTHRPHHTPSRLAFHLDRPRRREYPPLPGHLPAFLHQPRNLKEQSAVETPSREGCDLRRRTCHYLHEYHTTRTDCIDVQSATSSGGISGSLSTVRAGSNSSDLAAVQPASFVTAIYHRRERSVTEKTMSLFDATPSPTLDGDGPRTSHY
jgi:hypothetical protein